MVCDFSTLILFSLTLVILFYILAALKYLLENPKDSVFDKKKFEEACGVGINVTDEEIERIVKAAIEHHKSEIVEKR